MNKINLLLLMVFLNITFSSCSTDDLPNSKSNAAEATTLCCGEDGDLPPPPPPPPPPIDTGLKK
ncbi:hypothetical protein [Flavobacterium litorale]|uniref:Uncharacterized protein n=1 Tax=Flavobacterium litorale TaxID=2856519 RepID=A0ABX8V619_9FLAO|nr:hypothetical protein [Flavobacterium litorale]QYJ68255.1 hypothetical protein K1I41_12125 [Flavobacterium litorale]